MHPVRPGAGPPRDRPAPSPDGAALAWGVAIAWAAFVWWLGSSDFDAATTSRWLEPLLAWLLPEAPELRQAIAVTIRKLAHPVEYALLAWLCFRAASRSGLASTRAAATAFGLSLALAASDELRQAGLAERSGSALDVALDAAGAVAALAALLAWRATR